MSDQAFWILIILLLIVIGLIVVYVCVKLIIYGLMAKNFIEEVDELHHRAYTGEDVQTRRMARERFDYLVERAAKSKNPRINNPRMAEDLIRMVDYTVSVSVMGKATDAEEARSWGSQVKRLTLEPMRDQVKRR